VERAATVPSVGFRLNLCMDHLKKHASEILRWSAVALFGEFGVWQLSEIRRDVVAGWNGNLSGALFGLIFSAVIAAPLLAVAYICFRRQYRSLFILLGILGSILVYVEVVSLPFQLGLFGYFDRHAHDSPLVAVLGLPLGLVLISGNVNERSTCSNWMNSNA
jgi:hypothetical protein